MNPTNKNWCTPMNWDEWQKKCEEFVNGMVDGLKNNGGIAKDAVSCPECKGDITEWWLRRELHKSFMDLMMKHGVYPEPPSRKQPEQSGGSDETKTKA
jgi:hypothetical protein